MVVKSRQRLFVALALAVGITGCDQGTKFRALASLTDTFHAASSLGERLELFLTHEHPSATRVLQIVPGFWEHRYVENPRSAFSVWSGSSSGFGRTVLLLIRSAIAAFLVLYLAKTKSLLATLGIASVLGGAVGNLFDGLRFGYVIDFIHWHWHDAFGWPVFNIADAAITVGIALLLMDMLREKRRVAT
jgi:signal peptidase II